MKRALFVALLGLIAIALGCGPGGGAEGTAKKLLEATKTGDADTLADHIDWKGMYESIPEEYRGDKTVEDFEKEARAEMKKHTDEANEEFEYEILSCEEEGDTATLKVKTKENKDADWEERTIILKKIDGKWVITMEGLQDMGD